MIAEVESETYKEGEERGDVTGKDLYNRIFRQEILVAADMSRNDKVYRINGVYFAL